MLAAIVTGSHSAVRHIIMVWFMSGASRAMLRVSIGYLLMIWGVDKLVNPAHGLAVPDRYDAARMMRDG